MDVTKAIITQWRVERRKESRNALKHVVPYRRSDLPHGVRNERDSDVTRRIEVADGGLRHRIRSKGFDLRRPKGAQGRQLAGWLTKEQAFALLAAAIEFNMEFGVLCTILLYTGCRLSEALKVRCADVNLSGAEMFVRTTKNGEPRRVFLPVTAVTALANHPRGLDRGTDRVFRFTKSGALYGMLRRAAKTAGVALPAREAFHIFCHTYATWCRRYADADLDTLVATGRWKSRQSAQRYMHMVVSEESQRAELLPALSLNYC